MAKPSKSRPRPRAQPQLLPDRPAYRFNGRIQPPMFAAGVDAFRTFVEEAFANRSGSDKQFAEKYADGIVSALGEGGPLDHSASAGPQHSQTGLALSGTRRSRSRHGRRCTRSLSITKSTMATTTSLPRTVCCSKSMASRCASPRSSPAIASDLPTSRTWIFSSFASAASRSRDPNSMRCAWCKRVRVTRPSATNTVLMVNDRAEVQGMPYDAAITKRSLSAKYGVK